MFGWIESGEYAREDAENSSAFKPERFRSPDRTRTNHGIPPGTAQPQLRLHDHNGTACLPLSRFADTPPLRCNPHRGAAGSTRSQGFSKDRDFENQPSFAPRALIHCAVCLEAHRLG